MHHFVFMGFLSVGFFLVGCQADGTPSAGGNPGFQLVDQYQVETGRLLASHCAQCHGTNGQSVTHWESLAGEDDLFHEMLELKSEAHEYPIMHAQARGYTREEMRAMAAWFATQTGDEHDSDDDDGDDD